MGVLQIDMEPSNLNTRRQSVGQGPAPTEAEVLQALAHHLIEAADLEGLHRLQEVLQEIQGTVEKRLSLSPGCSVLAGNKPCQTIRILLPGCFDMMHAGHYNA